MIRVLIVDDEYIMRQGLKYMIHWEQEGYEIVGEATNGNEALRLTEELKPHIIISDIVMSVMDGVAFTEMVHKIYPDIAIIILSGYDKFEYVKKTLTNGAIDYILKPTLNEEELLDQGIKPNTIRLSIGTENVDDIIEDLEEAFKAVK